MMTSQSVRYCCRSISYGRHLVFVLVFRIDCLPACVHACIHDCIRSNSNQSSKHQVPFTKKNPTCWYIVYTVAHTQNAPCFILQCRMSLIYPPRRPFCLSMCDTFTNSLDFTVCGLSVSLQTRSKFPPNKHNSSCCAPAENVHPLRRTKSETKQHQPNHPSSTPTGDKVPKQKVCPRKAMCTTHHLKVGSYHLHT